MIWFKERGPQGYDHGLYDSVRGIERLIYPDLTQAETDTVTVEFNHLIQMVLLWD